MTPAQIQLLLAQGRVKEAIAETIAALRRGDGADPQWVELLEEDLLGPLAELHRTGKWKVKRQLPAFYFELARRKAELEAQGMSADAAKDRLKEEFAINKRYIEDALAKQKRIEETGRDGLDLMLDRNAWWPQPPRQRKPKPKKSSTAKDF